MLLIPIQATSADPANLCDMEAGLSFSPFSLPCTEMQPSLVSDYSELPLINFQLFISLLLLNLVSLIYYARASFSETAEKLANFSISSDATSSVGGLWGEKDWKCSRLQPFPPIDNTWLTTESSWHVHIIVYPYVLLSFQAMVCVCFRCSYSTSLLCLEWQRLGDLADEWFWFVRKCMMWWLKLSFSTDWPSFLVALLPWFA